MARRFRSRNRRRRRPRRRRGRGRTGNRALRMVMRLRRNIGHVERKFTEGFDSLVLLGFEGGVTPEFTTMAL